MPMWTQTYYNGQRCYREHKASRNHTLCPSTVGSIPCHIPNEQIGNVVEAIEMGPQCLEEVLSVISLKDEVDRMKKQRAPVLERLRPLGNTYNNLLIPYEE